MASMNGLSLKAVKEFDGLEGAGFSANIYMDGKSVGSVLDSAYGGCYDYNYNSKDLETVVSERIKDYYTEHPAVNTLKIFTMKVEDFGTKNLPVDVYEDILEPEDRFFFDLLMLTKTEKSFKKAQKKGGFIVILDYYSLRSVPTPLTQEYTAYQEKHIDEILQIGLKQHPTAHIKVYKTLEDFILK